MSLRTPFLTASREGRTPICVLRVQSHFMEEGKIYAAGRLSKHASRKRLELDSEGRVPNRAPRNVKRPAIVVRGLSLWDCQSIHVPREGKEPTPFNPQIKSLPPGKRWWVLSRLSAKGCMTLDRRCSSDRHHVLHPGQWGVR